MVVNIPWLLTRFRIRFAGESGVRSGRGWDGRTGVGVMRLAKLLVGGCMHAEFAATDLGLGRMTSRRSLMRPATWDKWCNKGRESTIDHYEF